MLTEGYLLAELEYRQQRFREEADAYRLAKSLRSAARERSHRTGLAAVADRLALRRGRHARQAEANGHSGTVRHAA